MEKIKCILGDEWKLDTVNSDEFDGDALNTERWYDYAPGWRGRKEFLYKKNNVAVSDGKLLLTARCIDPSEMEPEDLADGILPRTMPFVKSRNKVLYGYFECLSKGCNAEVRNAFWLYDPLSDDQQAKHSPGNCSEEIDIYEFIGRFRNDEHAPYVVNAAVHRFATPYTEGIVNWVRSVLPKSNAQLKITEPPSAGFHNYSLLWTPFEVVWFVDGKEFHRRENDYFHRPMHICFNCELARWRGAEVQNFVPEDSPAVQEICYFRRWVKE